MAKHISPEEEAALADRLRREAEAVRPAFCEALHARICRAVNEGEAPARPRPVVLTLRRLWPYAFVAAACAVAAVLVVWRLSITTGPEPTPREIVVVPYEQPESLPGLDALTGVTDRPVEHVGMLVDSTLTTQQWAYLDHDARLALGLLIDQLPLEIASAGVP